MISVRNGASANGVEATMDERDQLRGVQVALDDAADSGESAPSLVGKDGKRIVLPEPLFQILRHAAELLVRGERVTLAPVTKELSSQEAADLLGVSRPYLIKLLDAGEIPFTKVGRSRRVRFGDVNRYRNDRDKERRDRLRRLIRSSEEMGLYDIDEFDLTSTR